MAHLMSVASSYRPREFSPFRYDLLSYLRLNGSETYEAGTELDIKRIQSVPDPGSAGGMWEVAFASGSSPRDAVQFAAGRAVYFGGFSALGSSAPASAFRAFHNAEQPVRGGLVFRADQLRPTVGSILLATSGPNNNSPGVWLTINSNRSITWQNQDGTGAGGSVAHTSDPGLISAGATYVITYDVSLSGGSALTKVWIDGDLAIDGTRSNPSASDSNPFGLGGYALGTTSVRGRLIGLIDKSVVFAGSNLPDITELETWLSQFTLDDDVDQLVGQYAAEGSLVHAYVPASIVSSEGDVTAWEDTVSGEHLLPVAGTPTVDELDGMDAVTCSSGEWMRRLGGLDVSGTNTRFSVIVYGSATPSEGAAYFWDYWLSPDGYTSWHDWLVTSSGHSVVRHMVGDHEASTIVANDSGQRFFGHSFHGANSPFNLKVIDTAVSAPALDIPTLPNSEGTLEATMMVVGVSGSVTASHRFEFNRALNSGEMAQWRDALERAHQ